MKRGIGFRVQGTGFRDLIIIVILNLFQDLNAWGLFLKGTKTNAEIYAWEPNLHQDDGYSEILAPCTLNSVPLRS